MRSVPPLVVFLPTSDRRPLGPEQQHGGSILLVLCSKNEVVALRKLDWFSLC